MSTHSDHTTPPPDDVRSGSSRTSSSSVSAASWACSPWCRASAADHRMARRQRAVTRGLRRHSRRVAGRLLHRDPRDVGVGCDRVRRSRPQLGARRTRSPAHHDEERQATSRRLPRRRVHAHAAARLRRRADALDDLLRVPRPARGDHRARGRPSDAGERQVPPRHARTWPTRCSPTSPAWCSWSASSGRSCAGTCSARTASASRPSRSTRLILGTFFVIGASAASSPRRSASPRSSNRATRSGASSAIR